MLSPLKSFVVHLRFWLLKDSTCEDVADQITTPRNAHRISVTVPQSLLRSTQLLDNLVPILSSLLSSV